MSENNETKNKNIAIDAQYVKDLSFENPNSPMSLTFKDKPKIDLNLDLAAKPLSETTFEVTIHLTVKATSAEEVAFVTDLKYSGVFTLTNIEGDEREFVLLVTCPTILFPYARRVMSDTTRDGGFQPLMVDPIDFQSLYMQNKAKRESELQAEKTESVN